LCHGSRSDYDIWLSHGQEALGGHSDQAKVFTGILEHIS